MFLPKVALAGSLLQVTKSLPQRGLGCKLQRVKWQEDSFWTITAVKPHIDGKHGKASGILTWKGETQTDQPVRINGVLKKVWRHVGLQGLQDWKTVAKPDLETAAAEA